MDDPERRAASARVETPAKAFCTTARAQVIDGLALAADAYTLVHPNGRVYQSHLRAPQTFTLADGSTVGCDRDLIALTPDGAVTYCQLKDARAVGPFVFVDHFGPAPIKTGHELSVRPHPHIGLATVTYLYDGVIFHKDSIGSEELIQPDEVNWMTAGRGIVHSEHSRLDERYSFIEGIQTWVALPTET